MPSSFNIPRNEFPASIVLSASTWLAYSSIVGANNLNDDTNFLILSSNFAASSAFSIALASSWFTNWSSDLFSSSSFDICFDSLLSISDSDLVIRRILSRYEISVSSFSFLSVYSFSTALFALTAISDSSTCFCNCVKCFVSWATLYSATDKSWFRPFDFSFICFPNQSFTSLFATSRSSSCSTRDNTSLVNTLRFDTCLLRPFLYPSATGTPTMCICGLSSSRWTTAFATTNCGSLFLSSSSIIWYDNFIYDFISSNCFQNSL